MTAGLSVARGLRSITEAEWQRVVVGLAHLRGWRTYHTYDSRRSAAGFPDLTLARDRLIFAELKTDKGRVSAAQAEWLDALRAAGVEAHVWRPRDLSEVTAALR